MESLADQVFAKIIASGFFISITHFANNEVNQEQSRKRKHGTEQNLTAESARRIQMVQRSMLLTENNYSVVTCRSGMGLTMSLKPRVCLTFNEWKLMNHVRGPVMNNVKAWITRTLKKKGL